MASGWLNFSGGSRQCLLRFSLLLLSLLSLIEFTHMRISTDILQMLPKTPAVRSLQSYNATFSSLDRFAMCVTVESDQTRLLLAAHRAVALLRSLPEFAQIQARWDLMPALAIHAFYETQLPNLLGRDLTVLETFLTPEHLDSSLAAIWEEAAGFSGILPGTQSDPLRFSQLFWQKLPGWEKSLMARLENGYLVATGNRLAVLLRLPADQRELTPEAARRCWQHLERVETVLRREIETARLIVIGGKRVALDNATVIQDDIQLTSTMAIAGTLLVMFLTLRNFYMIPLILLPSFFGMFVGMGMCNLLVGHVSLLTLGYGAVLIGISLDCMIHYCIHLESSDTEDAQRLMARLFYPMSFAALSTILAVAMLLFSPLPGHVEIGYFVAFGIVGSFLLVVVIIPPLARRLYPQDRTPLRQAWLPLTKVLAKWQTSHGQLVGSVVILLLTVIVTVLAIGKLDKLRFTADLEQFNYVAPSTQAAEATFFSLWGDQRGKAAITVVGEDWEQLLERNERLYALLTQAQARGELTIATPSAQLLPSLSTLQQNHAAWKNFWQPEKLAKLEVDLAQVGKKYGFSKKAFAPFWEKLRTPPTPVSTATLWDNPEFRAIFQEQIREVQGKWHLQHLVQPLQPQAWENLQSEILAKIPGSSCVARRAMLREIDVLLRRQSFWLAITSSLVIFLLLILYFPHLELVLITSLPLLLSLLWVLGFMAWQGIALNIFSLLVLIFLLGLGLDYAAFSTAAYFSSIGYRDDSHNQINHINHIRPTQSAIILTTAATMLGFGVLLLSRHPALYATALCVVVGMGIVMVLSLLLTPLLLRYFVPADRDSHPLRLYHALSSLWGVFYFAGSIALLSLLIFPLVAMWQKLRRRPDPVVYRRLMRLLSKIMMATSPEGPTRLIHFPQATPIHGSVVVANHTNSMDIPLYHLLPFDKITIVKWLWHFPLVASMMDRAGYLCLAKEKEFGQPGPWLEYCQSVLKNRGNLFFFPEGTRVQSLALGRFHLGAFQLAVANNAPVLPVCFYGSRWIIARKRFAVREFELIASALPCLSPENFDYSLGARALANEAKRRIAGEYERLAQANACKRLQLRLVSDCYRNLDPYFDWRLRWKLWRDKAYSQLPRLLPRAGKILEVGCQEGFLSQLTLYSGEQRQVTGIDPDPAKIELADRAVIAYTHESLRFLAGDIVVEAGKSLEAQGYDGVLCCDYLRRFPTTQHGAIILAICMVLKPGGLLVIRDAQVANSMLAANGLVEREPPASVQQEVMIWQKPNFSHAK